MKLLACEFLKGIFVCCQQIYFLIHSLDLRLVILNLPFLTGRLILCPPPVQKTATAESNNDKENRRRYNRKFGDIDGRI